MRLIYLQNPTPCFQPTDEQVRRFAERLGPEESEESLHVCRSEEEFVSLLPEATAVFVWTFRQEWFDRAPKLRHLATPAAGRDYFRIVPPPTVTLHYGSFHGAIMAETALGAVLSCAHGLLPHASAMKGPGAAEWPRPDFVPGSRRVAGSTVLVLGFGSIGRSFGRLAKALGATVVGFRRHPAPDPAADRVVGPEALDKELSLADHVVCFLPSGPETTHLLDARRLALFKPSAFLYNFGRGNLIDEAALDRALRAHAIAGAVLDVFETEPLPTDSPLRTAPNAFLYPHASAFSPDYLDLYFEAAARAIKACRFNLHPNAP